MISVDDFLLFCNRTLDGYDRALAGLDDETVNALPPLPDPNSAYQLVTHAVGARTWWTARVVCGHEVERDRHGEFNTAGTADDARKKLADFRRLLAELGPELATASELAIIPNTQTPLGAPWTVGAALIHVYEELAQHLGHLQITVDLVGAAPASPASS